MASLYMGLVNRTALLARSWPEVKSATARSVLPHVSYSKSTWNVEEPTLSGSYWQLGTDRVLTWGTADNETYNWSNPQLARAVFQPAFDAYESVANIDFRYGGHDNQFKGTSKNPHLRSPVL